MNVMRKLLPAALLALGLALPGCILTSAQILAAFDLTNPLVVAGANDVEGVVVDLNTISDYQEHKSKLNDVLDLALLGEFEHLGGNPIALEVWMTPAQTSHTTAAAVTGDPTAIKVWGTFSLPVGGKARIGWDESAKLFDTAGKAALVQEIKGDGVFTLYALGAGGTYAFQINNGAFVVILDANT